MMRRMAGVFLKLTNEAGQPHPYFETALSNYAGLLEAMGKNKEEILATLDSLAPDFSGD